MAFQFCDVGEFLLPSSCKQSYIHSFIQFLSCTLMLLFSMVVDSTTKLEVQKGFELPNILETLASGGSD